MKRVRGREQIGAEQSFFELGGHSREPVATQPRADAPERPLVWNSPV
ncbi:MAG TPA: hypothetical protein VGK45_02315 [Thermoanaerobaculia bacterium]|jgi:hypothetical protein